VNFDTIDRTLIRYCVFVRYWRKWEYNGTVHQLLIHFKKVCDSVRRELLYDILTEFGTAMNLLRLIEMTIQNLY
jgi:hypothetical protein